ncbi:hypothetical protein AAZX31_09G115800 [Glycine max]
MAQFTVLEKFTDIFIGWPPMYGLMKLVLFVYLWYPKTKRKRILKYTLGSLRGFHYENCKLQQILSAIRTFLKGRICFEVQRALR